MVRVAAASLALRAADQDTLLVVETVDGPRFPNGVILDPDPPGSRPGGVVTAPCGPNRPRELGWDLPLSARRWWDPTCPVGGLDPERVAALIAGLDPLPLPGEPSACVGWGPGLTPAGDDVIVGMLIGFHAAGARDRARELALACTPVETVPMSRALLDHAAVGEAAGPVLAVMAALARRGDLDEAVGALLRFGATSGAHILDGLRRALDEVAAPLDARPELVS